MATLKISELSVGDWVQDKNGIYAKVIGMENWSNGYFLNIELHGVNVGVTPLASIHPIPITAEILEKIGFKSTSSYWSIYNDNDDYIEIWRNKDKWYLSVNSVEYTLCDLHWVHQIQHLMRVWGIDKEINL